MFYNHIYFINFGTQILSLLQGLLHYKLLPKVHPSDGYWRMAMKLAMDYGS
jgi:hypothetical protein